MRILDQSQGVICGGTLISPTEVITAKHCLYKSIQNDLSQMTLHLGDWRLFNFDVGEQVRTVDSYTTHDEHDVAIITLNETVYLNDCVEPSILYGVTPTVTKPLMVAGWGLTSSNPNDLANEIQELMIPMADTSVSSIYQFEIKHMVFCI